MRKIDKIIVHCSATPKGKHFSAETIKSWHLKRGFSDIGYHFIIHLCYIGGMNDTMEEWVDTRTDKQKDSLVELLSLLKKFHPNAEIFGHRDFSDKPCPSFNAREEYKYICNDL